VEQFYKLFLSQNNFANYFCRRTILQIVLQIRNSCQKIMDNELDRQKYGKNLTVCQTKNEVSVSLMEHTEIKVKNSIA